MASDKQTGDFGARLREARERRGLTLRVIADTTKISVRALEALERNDISHLPGGIFSRAFVRGYATEVGLDPEQTVAEFITRFPDEFVTQGHPRTRALVDELERDSRRSGPNLWRWALVGLPVVALIVYFAIMGRRVAPRPVQSVSAAAAQPAPVRQPVPKAGISVSVRVSRTTTVTVAADGGASTEVVLDPGSERSFFGSRELLLSAAEPSAVQWSVNGRPARAMTGPVRLTTETLQDFLAGQ